MRKATPWGVAIILLFLASCSNNRILMAPIAPASASTEHLPAKTSERSAGEQAITPELLKQKSIEAREFLKLVPVKEFACTIREGRRRHKLKGREIALGLLDPVSRENRYAKIGICFSSPQKTLTVLDGNLPIRWLRGRGITHFAFESSDDNAPPIVVDSKQWMRETQRGEYYFPYTDDFLFIEFVLDGARFLLSQVRQAQEELCALNIRSRTFPLKKLCGVFPDNLVLNVALIEQIDEDEFGNACPHEEMLPPHNRIFQNCAEYSVFKVLVHYARNTYDAFRYVGSRAGALCPFQFTPKTYRDIALNKYPEATLIRDFETGARDLKNSIKAAMCLLDYELSRMPPRVHQIFLLDYRAGGLYPVVAYNGGKNRAQCLFRQKRTGQCKANRSAWRETTGYIAKYQGIWYIIDNLVSALEQN